jgi:PIN domain nuclease of toxin-antitoxin system
VLLDAHVLLWWMADARDRLSSRAITALSAPGASVVVSAVTVWEIAIKRGLGKLDAPEDLVAQLERAGVALLPITARHADAVASLPSHHRDPFDRLLIAQSKIERLPVVTADGPIGRYDIEVVW